MDSAEYGSLRSGVLAEIEVPARRSLLRRAWDCLRWLLGLEPVTEQRSECWPEDDCVEEPAGADDPRIPYPTHFDTEEAAEYLGVSVRTVQRWCVSGNLSAKRDQYGLWRIDAGSVVRLWMDRSGKGEKRGEARPG